MFLGACGIAFKASVYCPNPDSNRSETRFPQLEESNLPASSRQRLAELNSGSRQSYGNWSPHSIPGPEGWGEIIAAAG